MKNQRGLTFLGALITAAIVGGIYYGVSVMPVYFDNLAFKQAVRAVGNDWVSRTVTNPAHLEPRVRLRAKENNIDDKELKVQVTAIESDVTINVEYRRVWKLLFTEKAYAKRFSWQVNQKR